MWVGLTGVLYQLVIIKVDKLKNRNLKGECIVTHRHSFYVHKSVFIMCIVDFPGTMLVAMKLWPSRFQASKCTEEMTASVHWQRKWIITQCSTSGTCWSNACLLHATPRDISVTLWLRLRKDRSLWCSQVKCTF